MSFMSVPHCTICNADDLHQQSPDDLAQGDYCPVCHNPTCRRHLTTVRFRWRECGQVDQARVCKTCKTSYQHRYWDTARRDWIS
jgi:hypothetical protein